MSNNSNESASITQEWAEQFSLAEGAILTIVSYYSSELDHVVDETMASQLRAEQHHYSAKLNDIRTADIGTLNQIIDECVAKLAYLRSKE